MAERVSAEFNALEQSSIKVSSKIGNQIMLLMGWKPGQGIGPLTTVVQQQQHSVGGDGDDQDKQQRLPPRPVALVDCEPPTQNRHGLGYGVDLDALPVNSDNTADDLGTPALPALGAIFKSKPKTEDSKPKLASKAKKKRQQKTDMLRLSFGSFGEDEDEDNGQGNGIAGGMGRSKTQLERLVDERAKPVPKRTMPQTQLDQMASLCHDGRPPLSGFELVRLAEDSDALYYEGPEVPSTYNGMRDQAKSFRWDSAPATGSQLNLKDANNSGGSRFTMAENRTKLSVMADAPKPPPAHEAVNAATATAALAGFMPFADNLEKQSRYRQYLETCAKSGDKNPSVSATVLSKLSSEKESQEFTRLAQLFRPNTTMLSRFTRATSDLDTAPEETAKVTEDKSVGSAKNKTIVRAVLDWVPSQLLCKRMGIAPPAHLIVNQPKQRNSDSVKCVDEQQQKMRGRRQQASDFIQWRNADFDNPSKATGMVDSVLVSDDITSSLHTDATIIPEKRPNMALFESIFGDDADS
ncbi:argininosuccinate lyase [Kickxella alabastrina]|nr:argininosuccinate lyase [Kickxella alabastrina]